MSAARGGRVRSALLAAIGFYSRAISPALPPRCRFYPTCSAYAAEAISRHGAARGSWLALRRLLKCAPWHAGGVDLVPGATAGVVHGEVPDDRSGTPVAGHSSSTPEAPAAPPADGARRPHPAPQPPATPPLWRRAPYEESSVA